MPIRALVVDDDPATTTLIKIVLAELGDVDVAHSGAEALERARARDYDVLVLDLTLPGISGLDVLQTLRREGSTTPVLVLTGHNDPGSVVTVLDAGADDYVTKPVDNAVLRARVRALRRRAGSGDTLTLGPLVIDRVAHRVEVRGTEIPLTPKEYGLLHHFVTRPGEVVSRTELLAKVWGMDFDPGSNVVDVSIARVRRKLERFDGTPRIETVRGVGFMLVSPGDATLQVEPSRA